MPKKKILQEEEQVRLFHERLKQIRSFNRRLFETKKGSLETADLCRAIAGNGGFLSCWLALTDGSGNIKSISHSAMTPSGTAQQEAEISLLMKPYIKKLMRTEKLSVNRAPQWDRDVFTDGTAGSISMALRFRGLFLGVLSVTLTAGDEKKAGNRILVEEISESLSAELYSRNMENLQEETCIRLKNISAVSGAVFETTGTATLVVRSDNLILASNQEFARLAGLPHDKIDGKLSWTEFISRDDIKKMLKNQEQREKEPSAAPRNYEFRFVDHSGTARDIYGTFSRVQNSDMSVASFMDITSQKQLESEIIRISEQERQKIGQDLHDGLGPHLVGVKFITNILGKKLHDKNLLQEEKDIQEINTLLTQGINHTRRLVKGLCPVDIDAEGLIVALDDLTANTKNVYGLQCVFEHDESLFITDNIMATHLYLIAQESVNNAIKHSKASAIFLTIYEKTPGTVIMEIADNGTGPEKLLDRDSGVGINIMKYRARVIDASLEVKKNSMGGTSVLCTMKKNSDSVTVKTV